MNNFLSRTVPVKVVFAKRRSYLQFYLIFILLNLLTLHRNLISVATICWLYCVLLLSTSVVQLQRMLDLYVECGDKLDIIFNALKSVLFKVGKVYCEKLDNLYLGMKVLCWCDHF